MLGIRTRHKTQRHTHLHLCDGYPQGLGQVDELNIKAPSLQPLVGEDDCGGSASEELKSSTAVQQQ
jgi:hypothetical protein